MKRILIAALFAVLCLPAYGQWQTPNHSIPVGRGAGTGFKSVGPCNANVPVVGSGLSTDPACSTDGPIFSLNQQPTGSAPVWNRIGPAINPATMANCNASGTNFGGEMSVIYDTNPQILTSLTNVFKMWFNSTGSGVLSNSYAESPDGIKWTCYASNPVNGNYGAPRSVRKIGSTYVYWATDTSGNVDRLTSSNGISWTLANNDVLVKGTGGDWDIAGITNQFVWTEGSNYFMLYTAGVGSGYPIGLATSPDGITWTKYAGNPVITDSSGSCFIYKSNAGTYYCWTQAGPVASPSSTLPSDIWLYTSTDLHTWTRSSAPVITRRTWDEGASGWASAQGQVADMSMVEVGGRVFAYYQSNHDQQFTNVNYPHYNKVMVANMGFEQLITTNQGSAPVVSDSATVPTATNTYFSGTWANPVVIGSDSNAATLGAGITVAADNARADIGYNYYLSGAGVPTRINTSIGAGAISFFGGTSNTGNSIQATLTNIAGASTTAWRASLGAAGTADKFYIGAPILCINGGSTNSCTNGAIQGFGTFSGLTQIGFGNGTSGNLASMLRYSVSNFVETATPGTTSAQAYIWNDSTAHRPKFNYNGGSDLTLAGISGTLTSNSIIKSDANSNLVGSGVTIDNSNNVVMPAGLTIGSASRVVIDAGGSFTRLQTDMTSSDYSVWGGNAPYYFAISESWSPGVSTFALPFIVQETMTGGNGSRQTFAAHFSTTGAAGVGGEFYQGADFVAANYGTGSGNYFGIGVYGIAGPTAAATTQIASAEFDTKVQTTVARKVGVYIVDIDGSTGSSSDTSWDTGLSINAGGTAVGFFNAIRVENAGIKTGGNAFVSPGVTINKAGAITSTDLTVSRSAVGSSVNLAVTNTGTGYAGIEFTGDGTKWLESKRPAGDGHVLQWYYNAGSYALKATLDTSGNYTVTGGLTALGLTVSGSVTISTAANTLVLKQGANGSVGTFVCTSGGSITVNNSNVAVTDTIIISLNTAGGTISTAPALNAITAATSFVAKCATNDTSTYNYAIIKNAA